MARTHKQVERHFVDTVLDTVVCDLCGRVAEGASWERGLYREQDVTLEVTVHQREGDSYPEGGSGTEYIVDLCPQCFKNRLIPWLRGEGATIEEMDWDW